MVMSKKIKKQTNNKVTLCWNCKKACGGYDCEWAMARNYEPVPDWEAVATTVLMGTNGSTNSKKPRIVNSFLVLKCPKFEMG
jgi:hypothetical protein